MSQYTLERRVNSPSWWVMPGRTRVLVRTCWKNACQLPKGKALKMIGNVELEQIASTIEKTLKKVFDAIV